MWQNKRFIVVRCVNDIPGNVCKCVEPFGLHKTMCFTSGSWIAGGCGNQGLSQRIIMETGKSWSVIVNLIINSYFMQSEVGRLAASNYYRYNNYVDSKVCLCVNTWTWHQRHSNLNCLITEGSTRDWDNCLLLMLLLCV